MCISGALWWLWWWPLLTSAALAPPFFPCLPFHHVAWHIGWIWLIKYVCAACFILARDLHSNWQWVCARQIENNKFIAYLQAPDICNVPLWPQQSTVGSFADSPTQAYTQYFSKITNYNFLLRMFAIVLAEVACLRINLQLWTLCWQFAAH